jgi:hypothetical protein
MIEEGALVPFDDDKDLEEYTTKDFRELFEANFQERENKIRELILQKNFLIHYQKNFKLLQNM